MWKRLALAACCLLLPAVEAASAVSASELLEKAIYTEETLGDVDAAIKLYQQVVAEGEKAEAAAAQAQFRLGQCHWKKGRIEEAVAAFEKLIREYPDQKELVEKARKRVPAEFKLQPAPWKDGEVLQLTLKFPTGVELGSFAYMASKAEQEGRPIWQLRSHRYVLVENNQGYSIVDAEAESFVPLNSVFIHGLIGNFYTDYKDEEIVVVTEATGKKTEKVYDIATTLYDNEQGIHLMRRLPLEVGYKTTLPIFAGFGSGQLPIGFEVTAKETLDVPAGKFECFKGEMNIGQTFCFTTYENRYLIKFVGGGVNAELQSISHTEPNERSKYRDQDYNFTLSAPSGWLYYVYQPKGKGRVHQVHLLDPKAVARSFVDVTPADELKDEQRSNPRAWAESRFESGRAEFADFQVREDSWKEMKIGGQPAVSFTADFTQGERKKAQLNYHLIDGKRAVAFVAHVDRDKVDEYRKDFETIVNSYESN